MSHTPEPWKLGDYVAPETSAIPDCGYRILGKDGQLVATGRSAAGPRKQAHFNGARIIDCVNACAGLTPLTPEGASVFRECVEALKAVAQILHTPVSAWHDVGPMDAVCGLQERIDQALAHAQGTQ